MRASTSGSGKTQKKDGSEPLKKESTNRMTYDNYLADKACFGG
jgi:hypothetical protein